MSIDPYATGGDPDSGPPSPPHPTMVLIVATAFATVTGYYTDWETAVSVFIAIVSLFTSKRDQ